jgi:hypothetical protein
VQILTVGDLHRRVLHAGVRANCDMQVQLKTRAAKTGIPRVF